MTRDWMSLTLLATITCALSVFSGPLWAQGGHPDDYAGGDPRTEGLRVINLGPNSSLYLYDPVVGDVRLISSVENLGPDPMTYLDFYTLYPANLVNQEVIDLQFYPDGGDFIHDNRGQNIVHYHYDNIPAGVKHETWWWARVRTWEMLYDIDPDDVGTLGEIPPAIAAEYLADDPLFQITHPVITDARDEALQGETNPLRMAQKIFDWVQAALYYEAAGGWDDAVTVIQRGNGSCSEYAFVFIALCRSAGIPSRWTGSLVRRGDAEGPGPYQDDPHHRWAAVYLPSIGWVQCNVQGGTWGYLPNRYLIISESSGPSNYLITRYDSYRYWSFGGGTGSASTQRYGLWYSDLDSFFVTEPAGGNQIWPTQGTMGINWSIMGEYVTENTEFTLKLIRLGETVWTAAGLDPNLGYFEIPLSEISSSGPHFDLTLHRSDKPELAGYFFPIEIKDDIDADGLDDNWEVRYWGNLNKDGQDDPDRDGANNLCEYYGMTDPNKPTLYAGDVQELAGQVGQGFIGHNEYGCGLTGKIEVNGIAWDKSLGVHADSWIEYEVPEGMDMFRGMYALEDHEAGKVVFQCYLNDELVFTSGTVTKDYGRPSYPVLLELGVNPGDRLKLVADSLFDNEQDHACWLQPAFVGADISQPIIELSTTKMDYTAIEGGANPDDQSLFVRNSGPGILQWQVKESCPWLEVDPNSGSSAGEYDEIALHVNIAYLVPGPHHCNLVISDPCAINSLRTASVTVHILAVQVNIPSQQPTIQAGVDFVIEGGLVIVADGIYQGPGNRDIDFGGKNLTVRSAGGAENCIIDCQGTSADNHRGFYFHSGESPDAVVEGFTIINGYHYEGGGIYCNAANPTIGNCIFNGNAAEAGGGGIYIKESDSADIINCVVKGNSSTKWAGGILCTDNSSPTISNCIVIGNSTGNYGGGIYCRVNSNPTIVNCTFRGNTAASNGGGIRCYQSSPTVSNTIVWDNAPEQIYIVSGTPVVTYCDIQGSWSGAGNMDQDPCFADVAGDDYHLRSQAGRWDPNSWVQDVFHSPCIDTGDPATDWRPELWPHGGRINMGAYGGTAQASMSLNTVGNIADLNHDGIVDLWDAYLFCQKWLLKELLLAEDMDRNGCVDLGDWTIFTCNYLWRK